MVEAAAVGVASVTATNPASKNDEMILMINAPQLMAVGLYH